ncbi:MAG: ATP-dependent Clp protease proteolytic subunit [Chitinispirillaceae bacterium]|nr:ATP-dependent Clp protease proteolytic subunit [Chitinispirillaceae bacterium]
MPKSPNDDMSKKLKKMMSGSEIEEQLLKRREIFLWGEINDESAESIVKKILFFDGQNHDDIIVYINSPGGVISSGLAIYDAMQYAGSAVSTVCQGQAASMAAVILCAGTKGKRLVWEHSRVLIHQPLISGNMFGPASDIQIQAEEMLRIRDNLNEILAKHTGQSIKKIAEDTDRDFFMSADEAKKYGIVDKIIKKS